MKPTDLSLIGHTLIELTELRDKARDGLRHHLTMAVMILLVVPLAATQTHPAVWLALVLIAFPAIEARGFAHLIRLVDAEVAQREWVDDHIAAELPTHRRGCPCWPCAENAAERMYRDESSPL